MASSTQGQPYPGNYTPPTTQQGSQQPAYATDRSSHSNTAQSTPPQPFEKYCIIHIATTCDEHGVYVTKDSAEVIEIGWTVVDARDPSLPEVRLHHSMVLFTSRHIRCQRCIRPS